jgi:hypothetical protein
VTTLPDLTELSKNTGMFLIIFQHTVHIQGSTDCCRTNTSRAKVCCRTDTHRGRGGRIEHSCPGATQARVEHTHPGAAQTAEEQTCPCQLTALSAVEQARPGAAQAAMDRHFHGGS